jgi:hypothetical protein
MIARLPSLALGGMSFPLEQAKANSHQNYFHQGFVGSAVQVVGFGVWWQGLSFRQVRPLAGFFSGHTTNSL